MDLPSGMISRFRFDPMASIKSTPASGRLELSDLVASYPPINARHLQTLLSAKREYRDLAAPANEKLPRDRGCFFRHQVLVKRHMTIYPTCMLIAEAGTGKTCTIAGLAEYYRDNPAEIKHVYILTSGKTLKNDFKKQLACVCTTGVYETESSRKANNSASQKMAISLEIKKWYTVTTYDTFTEMLSREYPVQQEGSNARLTRDYSGCIFYTDEVQRIKVDPYSKNIGKRDRGRIYSQLWRLFHLVERSKIITASATPMTNDANELAAHLDLILPIDQQIVPPIISKNEGENFLINLPANMRINQNIKPTVIDFNTVTLDELRPYLQGRISYVRAGKTGAVPEYIGNPINVTYEIEGRKHKSQLIVDELMMMDFQRDTYLRVEQEESQQRERGERVGSWFTNQRHAANFVFPDGSYGQEGFKKYVEEVKPPRGSGSTYYRAKPELWSNITGPDLGNLKHYSIKTYTQVTRAVSGQMRYDENGRTLEPINPTEKGKRYVFCHDVVGGGVIVKGLCYEAAGYKRFMDNKSVFETIEGNLRPFCQESEGTGRRIRPDFKKEPRYAIISHQTPKSDAEREIIFELYNSPENIDGEYIQAILITPIGEVGINLTGVMHVEFEGPEWTPSSQYQVQNRAFRATSHNDLIKRIINEQGLSKQVKSDIQLKVRVHLYSSMYQIDGKVYPTKDTPIYLSAESKDFGIRRVLRMMKQLAFDCQLHRSRNIREGDIDGSQTCDYMECNYQCADPTPTYIDSSTYDVFYYDEIVSEVGQLVLGYFKRHNMARIPDLQKIFPNVTSERYFHYALEYLITNKVQILDRYGFPTYIREDNGTFYLTRSYPRSKMDSDFASAYYSEVMIGLNHNTLEDVVNEKSALMAEFKAQKILSNITDPTDLRYELRHVSHEVATQIIEQSLHTFITTNKPTQQLDTVFKSYIWTLYQLSRPDESIASRALAEGKKKVKVIKSTVASTNMMTFNMNNPRDDNTVYIHTMYINKPKGTGYAAIKNFIRMVGTIRIYIPKEGKWRDTNNYETDVYSSILREYINDLMTYYDKYHSINNIFGIFYGNKFMIAGSKRQRESNPNDARLLTPGQVCKTYYVDGIIGVMWSIGMPLMVPAESQLSKVSKENMERYLIENMGSSSTKIYIPETPLELSYYYNYVYAISVNNVNKETLCNYIALYMASKPQGKDMIISVSGDYTMNIENMIEDDPEIYEPAYEYFVSLKQFKPKMVLVEQSQVPTAASTTAVSGNIPEANVQRRRFPRLY